MVLTEFLRNLTSGNLATLASQAAAAPQTITRTTFPAPVVADPSFQSSLSIFSNILSGGELPETFRESTVTENLLGLGEASKTISDAVNQQIIIREQQQARTQEAIRNQQLFTESVNQRLSGQVTQLGQSLTQLSSATGTGFDPIKFFTDNPLIGGIGIGGLAVGAVVLLLVLRR